MEIINRIKKLADERGLSLAFLCQKMGVGRSYFIDVAKRNGSIPDDKLNIIAKTLFTSVEYLKLGISAMPVSDVVFVPIYGKVAAGSGMLAEDEIVGEQPILSALVKNIGECFCLKVSGDSMLPRIQDGDILLVRKQSSVDSGSYAVVLIDDENGVVKKVEYDDDSVTLISVNPNYPPRKFAGAELQRLQVLGKVIQIISTLK